MSATNSQLTVSAHMATAQSFIQTCFLPVCIVVSDAAVLVATKSTQPPPPPPPQSVHVPGMSWCLGEIPGLHVQYIVLAMKPCSHVVQDLNQFLFWIQCHVAVNH